MILTYLAFMESMTFLSFLFTAVSLHYEDAKEASSTKLFSPLLPFLISYSNNLCLFTFLTFNKRSSGIVSYGYCQICICSHDICIGVCTISLFVHSFIKGKLPIFEKFFKNLMMSTR